MSMPILIFLLFDMIETYKILAGIYDNLVIPNIPILSESRTRGNSLKIVNRRCDYDLRKYSFAIESQMYGIVSLRILLLLPLLTVSNIDLINSCPHRN